MHHGAVNSPHPPIKSGYLRIFEFVEKKYPTKCPISKSKDSICFVMKNVKLGVDQLMAYGK